MADELADINYVADQFRLHDFDGSGTIDRYELINLLGRFGMAAHTDLLLASAGISGSGNLSFADFYRLLRRKPLPLWYSYLNKGITGLIPSITSVTPKITTI